MSFFKNLNTKIWAYIHIHIIRFFTEKIIFFLPAPATNTSPDLPGHIHTAGPFPGVQVIATAGKGYAATCCARQCSKDNNNIIQNNNNKYNNKYFHVHILYIDSRKKSITFSHNIHLKENEKIQNEKMTDQQIQQQQHVHHPVEPESWALQHHRRSPAQQGSKSPCCHPFIMPLKADDMTYSSTSCWSRRRRKQQQHIWGMWKTPSTVKVIVGQRARKDIIIIIIIITRRHWPFLPSWIHEDDRPDSDPTPW